MTRRTWAFSAVATAFMAVVLSGCRERSGAGQVKSRDADRLPFHYTWSDGPGMVVLVKVFAAKEKPGPNWIADVKPIPPEGLRVRARPGDTITVGVCVYNRCADDIFMGVWPRTFLVEAGVRRVLGASIPYPEAYSRLTGGCGYRDDSFQPYLRTVRLPGSISSIDGRRDVDLKLKWAFYYYRLGDAARYWKTEEKTVKLRLVSE